MNIQSYVRPLISAPGVGGAIAAAAATSMLPTSAKATIPPALFNVGDQLEIEATGRISSVITAPGTARFDVRMGGIVIFDSLAILLDTVAAHGNVGWILHILLTCTAIGNAGNFYGQGWWMCEDILGAPAAPPKGVLSAILPWNVNPGIGANVDLTVSNVLDLFFTQTVATGSVQLNQFSARLLQ